MDSKREEVIEYLEENESRYWTALEAIEDCGESRKWYESETDMKDLSLVFPDVLFTLKGEGEEAGDLWIKYFKNGKMQTCYARIEFDEHDESKIT